MEFNFLTHSGRPHADGRKIIDAFKGLLFVETLDDGFRITTNCMYPSNGLVRVTVRMGTESVVVSDEGETLGEALAAGIEVKNPDKLLGWQIRERSLLLRDGVIYTPRITFDDAPIAILHVANTAKEVSNWLYDHGKVKRSRDFRLLLSDFLTRTYSDQVSEARVVGASNKPHKFANIISFANGRKFIVDAVANDPSSINARTIANMDVKATNDPNLDQRIIYDDAEAWSAADLNLLQVGAAVVPFSRSTEVINRIAERARVS